MENTHALKFANRESERVTLGIRTFPHLLYGVSEDSPDHFKQKYTLVAGKGYIYLHEHNKGLAYPSQQRNNVLGAPDDQVLRISTNTDSPSGKPISLHRKKGRLADFLDKNGWMSSVYTMTGNERNARARQMSNQQRDRRINSLRPKITYHNMAAKTARPACNGFETAASMMSQRVQLRTRRNHLAERQGPATARAILKAQVPEHVTHHLAKTTLQWSPKRIKHSETLKLTSKPQLEETWTNFHELERWQKNSCKSKWVYKQSRSETQQNDPQKWVIKT